MFTPLAVILILFVFSMGMLAGVLTLIDTYVVANTLGEYEDKKIRYSLMSMWVLPTMLLGVFSALALRYPCVVTQSMLVLSWLGISMLISVILAKVDD